jgi:TetR/AcrR family transcriptional repressor of lmrAB and yxaGH operons
MKVINIMLTNREKILQVASELMEKQGYHATGINEIIKKSKAPKGSLYYYFPDGKEQIASEAVLRAGEILAARIREKMENESNPAQAIRNFLYLVANRMEETKFYTGSTLTMLAMETVTKSKRVNLACREAYQLVMNAFGDKLKQSGMDDEKAVAMAEMIVAAVEGSIVLSRTYQTTDPLRRVADHVYMMLKAA